MILDTVSNILFYEPVLPCIKAGMEKVASLKAEGELKIGRYEFEGGYLMVQQGETIPLEEGTFEAHRKFIDVQIFEKGSEEVAWAPVDTLETAIPYNPEKDAERLNGPKTHVVKVSEGMFYAVYPSDAHKPCSHTSEKQSFLKIVMKLPVQ